MLPHGLINSVPDKLGYKGEKLEAYIRWLVARVEKLRTDPAYPSVSAHCRRRQLDRPRPLLPTWRRQGFHRLHRRQARP